VLDWNVQDGSVLRRWLDADAVPGSMLRVAASTGHVTFA
jgi:hypothetical protein